MFDILDANLARTDTYLPKYLNLIGSIALSISEYQQLAEVNSNNWNNELFIYYIITYFK